MSQHTAVEGAAQGATLVPEELLQQILAAIRRRPIPLVGDDGDVILPFYQKRKAAQAQTTRRARVTRGHFFARLIGYCLIWSARTPALLPHSRLREAGRQFTARIRATSS
jgi:hypothetical protein